MFNSFISQIKSFIDPITIEFIDVELYDMLGQLVINETNIKRLDITSVPDGIYNMIILHKDIRITKRVIKQ